MQRVNKILKEHSVCIVCLFFSLVFFSTNELTSENFNWNLGVFRTIYRSVPKDKTYRLLISQGLTEKKARQISSIVHKEAGRYGIDPVFIFSIMFIESSFDFKAKSHADAMGLMQIIPSTAYMVAEKLGINVDDEVMFYDPRLNIKLGVWYMNMLLNKFDKPHFAVTAYNYGPGYVKGILEKGIKFPIKSYMLKIAKTYRKYLIEIDKVDSNLITLYEE